MSGTVRSIMGQRRINVTLGKIRIRNRQRGCNIIINRQGNRRTCIRIIQINTDRERILNKTIRSLKGIYLNADTALSIKDRGRRIKRTTLNNRSVRSQNIPRCRRLTRVLLMRKGQSCLLYTSPSPRDS